MNKFFKQSLLAMTLMCAWASTFATVAVSADLKTIATGAQSATMRLTLQNCGANLPRVIGTGVVAGTQTDFLSNATTGIATGTIYGNDQIDCGGVTNTVYSVSYLINGVPAPGVPTKSYRICSSAGTGCGSVGTFDPSTATPTTSSPAVVPPTGDTSYIRTDGGNIASVGALAWPERQTFKKGTLQNYHSIYCPTVHDGVTDDGPTINNCIQQALGSGTGGYIWSTVILPAGLTHIVTPINMTHTIGMILQGAGGDQISAANNTYLMCDTGATSAVCLDRTGSKNTIMRGFTMRSASTYAHPSQVLIIAGRDNVVTFSEFNELDHLYLFADHSASASVAYYNVTAETETLRQVKALADRPFAFASSNVLSVTSPYQPTFPGPIASMTNVTCDMCSATVFGSGTVAYGHWSVQDFLYLNSHAVLGGGYTPSASFSFSNSGNANIKIIGGQYEDLPRFIIANSAIDHLTVDSMVVAPTAPLIHFEATTGLTAAKINLSQVGGGIQYLFDSVGANTIAGSSLNLASTAGINDTNITVMNSVVFRDVNSGLVVNNSSDYIDLDDSGTMLRIRSGTFTHDYGPVTNGGATNYGQIGCGGSTPHGCSAALGDGTGWRFEFGPVLAGVFTPRAYIDDQGTINAILLKAQGLILGASGSTISDSRELIQSSHSCGVSTTCSNTANLSLREITGEVSLVSGTPSQATVSGISPAFTSSATYYCQLTPVGSTSAIAAGGIAYTRVSGSSFTITGPAGVTTDVSYSCRGN